MKKNKCFGEKIIKVTENNLRLFYLNINGSDFIIETHETIQLYIKLQSYGVNIVCLIETNIH